MLLNVTSARKKIYNNKDTTLYNTANRLLLDNILHPVQARQSLHKSLDTIKKFSKKYFVDRVSSL